MGQRPSKLNYNKFDDETNCNKRSINDGINFKNTELYKKISEKYSTDNGRIILDFKDENENPGYFLEIRESKDENITFIIFKNNKAYRPGASLNLSKLSPNYLELYGRWDHNNYKIFIKIFLCFNMRRSYDIRMILYDFNHDKKYIEEKIYWSRIKIKEYYIFNKDEYFI